MYALLLLAATACTAEAPLRSTLDSKGRTEVSGTALVTLARAAPRHSEAARDYLYLAPVEVNEMGARRYYLWVGIASTVDRAWLWAEPGHADALVLVFNGMPVTIPLLPWDPYAPSFATPAPTYAERRAPVSLDQLERLAAAEPTEVRLATGDELVSYALWRGQWADWQPFVVGLGADGR